MKLMPSAHEEREYETKKITSKRSVYLNTDAVERARTDRGYAAKITLFEEFLDAWNSTGYNLDLGSNTAGEAEVLVARGYQVVATDINEVALSYSKQRSKKFREQQPVYYAADAVHLPFDDEVFGSVTAFEVLHHLEKIGPALSEVSRVLKPGGKLFAYEPYALNPYRRLAELRFYFVRGIERSFTVRSLTRELEGSGLEVLTCTKHVLPPSTWKKDQVSAFRRFLKEFYFLVASRATPLFGSLVVVATKPGGSGSASVARDIEDSLRCPISGSRLVRDGDAYVAKADGFMYRYPVREGIPTLIPEDAEVTAHREQ